MIDHHEQHCRQILIDQIEAVSPSLATWARAGFAAGDNAGRLGAELSAAAAAIAPRRSIYLSGPMKGYPESNYPLFNSVAAKLRADGHRVHNPAEFQHDGSRETFPLRKAFAAYCKFICEEADTIVLLPGWEKSLGVSAELALAKNCGLNVIEWKEG